jgi:hypothetical protein
LAIRTGLDIALGVGGEVFDVDRRAGDHGRGLIPDCTGNLSRLNLGEACSAGKKQDRRKQR